MKKFNINLILILSLLFIIISLSAVSATDNINLNNTISDSIEHSTLNDKSVVDTISVSQDNNDKVNDIGDASLTELDTLIQNSSGNIIDLTQNYAYRYGDSKEGVIISKNNTIIRGNGHTIDGDGQSQIFKITGHNVTLDNIILKNANLNESYIIHLMRLSHLNLQL